MNSLHAQDQPPAGCDPDAIKLFVGNIPKNYTESQLLPLFSSVGKVVDLIVVRDRATHQSKGSAFVWYKTRALAEEAIQRLHKRHVLPDATGKQKQPMAVREASAPARQQGSSETSRSSTDQLSMYWQQQSYDQVNVHKHGYPTSSASELVSPSHSGSLFDSPLTTNSAALNEVLQQQGLLVMGNMMQGSIPPAMTSSHQLHRMPVMQEAEPAPYEDLVPDLATHNLTRSGQPCERKLGGAWMKNVRRVGRLLNIQSGHKRQDSMGEGCPQLGMPAAFDSGVCHNGAADTSASDCQFRSAGLLDSRVLSGQLSAQGSMELMSGQFGSTVIQGGSGHGGSGHFSGAVGSIDRESGQQSMDYMDLRNSKGMPLAPRSRTWSSGMDQIEGFDIGPDAEPGQGQGPGSRERVLISFVTNRAQVSVVNDHMHSIQALSGCQVNVRPNAAPGLFDLEISGIQIQVQLAAKLLQMLGFDVN